MDPSLSVLNMCKAKQPPNITMGGTKLGADWPRAMSHPTTADFLLNSADLDLHATVDGLDGTLTLLDVGAVDGGAVLDASVDDMDLSFLSELLQQGEPVPEPASPLSTTSSKELVVSSPSGRSDGTESSDDEHAPKSGTSLVVHKAAKENVGDKKAEDRKAKRRAQVAISARRHRSRKKVSCYVV
ncbi:unnamed protein product [Phytophthora fragariaefolia]|uniref:Unnamed protein product n=1 Tax=Phytophthora fragariaefolia TaxID=1490495 RepID=A0A9W7D8K5_9STRA|nr:unnamed protein product [Phytophthora fragariaefolia]